MRVSDQPRALSVGPVVVPAVRQRLEQLIETINQPIAQLNAEILELVQGEKERAAAEVSAGESEQTDELEQKWRAAIRLFVTIPGIGLLTACWLVVATLNFTMCETAEAAVHYVGLAPIARSSGTSVRGRAQIGHSRHARARVQLYVATL